MEAKELFNDFKQYLKIKNPRLKQECICFYIEIVNKFFEFFEKSFTKEKSIYKISERQLLAYRTHLYRNKEIIAYINTKLSIIGIFERFLIDTGRKEKQSFKKAILYYRNFKNGIKFDKQKKVEQEFESFLENKKPKLESTYIKCCIKNVKEYFEFANKHYKEKKKYIYELGIKKIILYRMHLKNKGYSVRTVNIKLKSLILYENFLKNAGKKREQGYVKKILYNEKIKRNINNISRESYEQMIKMAKKENNKHCLILILFAEYKIHTKEIADLRVNDINLNDKTILIGKRKIKLTKKAEDVLNSYLKDRKKLLNGQKNDYLFISHISKNKEKGIDRTSIRMVVKLYYHKLLESEDYYEHWRDCY